MRSFFLSFLFFLLWFIVAFVYLSNETTPKVFSFFNNLTLKKELSETTTSQTSIESEAVEDELFFDKSILENQALLHVFKDNIGYLFSLDTLFIKKNVDSIYFSTFEKEYFDKLLVYIAENENIEIFIESDYSATEKFETPNLGIKRGEFLSKILTENGVVPYLVNIKSNIKELSFSKDNTFYGGIQIHLKPLDSIRKAEITETRILERTVYPTFTFSKIIVNKNLDDFADELIDIIAKYPNRNVQIIGHTDNIGSAIDNYQLGLKYARQVRSYLISKKNIEASKLTATSRGEENPIDDNNTQEGRKNNLRIEFIIE